MKDEIIKYCYVCGFEFSGSKCFKHMRYPFYDCPCCFFEYGIEEYEDNVYTSKRIEWIKNGARFSVLECSPYLNGWTLNNAISQLSNLNGVDISNANLKKLNPNFNGDYDLAQLIENWKIMD